jgi:hypothetical protein
MTDKKPVSEEGLLDVMREVIWMARRYADGRSTYAPTTVNETIDYLLSKGMTIEADTTIGMYARDGDLGEWNRERQRFEKE